MNTIEFSREQKELLIEKVQHYLASELDIEIGSFDTEFLLDFFAREIGPHFYNQALYDAQSALTGQLENLTDSLYLLEKNN